MADGVRVFVFTWNTQTVRYRARTEPVADFVDELCNKIINGGYDLVAIGLQEDAIRDSPLIADESSLITRALTDHDYELLRVVELSGWGSTTVKALVNEWSYRPRGLRMTIFKRWGSPLDVIGIESTAIVCPGIKNFIMCGKGGVAVNLITNIGKIAFLNMHLPFESESLINVEHRHEAVRWQAVCLTALYNRVMTDYNPDYLFLFGDLNFRVQLPDGSGAAGIAHRLLAADDIEREEYIRELLDTRDELRLLLHFKRIPALSEGVSDSGPVFLPTCKMRHGRRGGGRKLYLTGFHDERAPSWCDRILYGIYNNCYIDCELYDRWELGTMNLSDHTAVIAGFRIGLL